MATIAARVTTTFLAVALLGLGTALFGIYTGRLIVPVRLNPFLPYDAAEPASWVSAIKYWRTLRDPSLCMEALKLNNVAFESLHSFGEGSCTVSTPVRITAAGIAFNHPFVATCPLALALTRFNRQAVEPLAKSLLGQDVVRVDHVGSYACRAVRTGSAANDGARLSEHAHANAIDITGFVLRDGQTISITQDWEAHQSTALAHSQFLHAIHDDACKAFNTTLGPDYNTLHRTHFHLDMGPYRLCD